MFRPTPLLRLAGALLLAVSPAWSQATAAEPDAGLSLQQAFAAAWARQPEAQSLSLRQVADLIGDRHFHAVSNARAVLEAEIGRVCRHSGKRQVLVQGEDPTNRRPDTRRFASRRAQR